MTPSHLLKLYRSDDHLHEMNDLLGPVRQRHEYPVIETMEPERKGPAWVYRLDLSEAEPPETFPIIFGDYMFNVRSALDHLTVAIAPRKHKYDVSFPIFTTDPFATDETSGDYLDPDAADRWIRMTQGLPDDCVAALQALQPHAAARVHGYEASNHALAMLSAMQNADKHRQLVPIITGLTQAEVTHNGLTLGAIPTLKHRAVLDRSPTKVEMKVEGSALIGVSARKTIWNITDFVTSLNHFVKTEVLPSLERFL